VNRIVKSFCRVCGNPSDKEEQRDGHRSRVHCERCRYYDISDSCVAILGEPSRNDGLLNTDAKKASVGHWLRERQRAGAVPLLKADVVEKLAGAPWFPTLHDQRENLIRLLGDAAQGPGTEVTLSSRLDQYAVGARSQDAIGALTRRLENEALVTTRDRSVLGEAAIFAVKLTFDGWLEYEALARGKTTGRTAFMAMPFNQPDLDGEWLPRLRKAVEDTGFTLRRVDDELKPGLIDVRMRQQIAQSRFLIVELTHANLGAHWEAGFAEGLGKPVIYTIREGHKAHFDVDHSLRIEWSPEKFDVALDLIRATIRNAMPDAVLAD